MNFTAIQPYIIPALLMSYLLWRFLRFRNARAQLPSLIAQGAVVVDVRSPGEFKSGASEGSINIPLDRLANESVKLDSEKTIVLCCASGTRSAMGATILRRKGFKNVINAGPWKNTVL